ncbi:hypothetical protein [Thermomonospora amylolytica]|uniref:hypothetical protein n=1 Tax=Thermomonospora amylolytica TaxID=1411117 RepID=UPI000E6C0BA7|nr:hypothetical protein [Thermomonospora amylolytica]
MHTHDPGVPEFTRPDSAYGRAEQAAAEVQARTGGAWVCWFGLFTRSYWGVPRRPHPWWGMAEAKTPVDLLIRIHEVDAHYGIRRGFPGMA